MGQEVSIDQIKRVDGETVNYMQVIANKGERHTYLTYVIVKNY